MLFVKVHSWTDRLQMPCRFGQCCTLKKLSVSLLAYARRIFTRMIVTKLCNIASQTTSHVEGGIQEKSM